MSSHTETAVRRFVPGSFLVATPFLPASPYRHSVVLVIQHDAHGALGFVVDNQLKSSLTELESFFRSTRGGSPAGSHRFPGLRLFSAIVRWPEGGLEAELDQGVWMVTPARLDMALSSDDLWRQLVRQIGRDVLRDGLGIRAFPVDPLLN
jgi:putative AlgH/UPF0301 family transcriptional regulator